MDRAGRERREGAEAGNGQVKERRIMDRSGKARGSAPPTPPSPLREILRGRPLEYSLNDRIVLLTILSYEAGGFP